ncbi:MAG: hypothetical protein V1870_04055 [Candidatus Aenigmatarchaeota archaeon]
MGQLSENQMIETLKKDPHFVAIHYFNFDGSYPEINLNLWEDDYKTATKQTIEIFKEYIGNPLIEDDFIDHDIKSKWIYTLRDVYPWFKEFYIKNALRVNRISMLMYKQRNLTNGYHGTNKDELTRLTNDLFTNIHRDNGYNTFPTKNKITAVSELQKKVYGLLCFLSEQSQSEK